ncbi:MAG: hypothetical protein ACOZB3_12435 [Calditrichota bacterium]
MLEPSQTPNNPETDIPEDEKLMAILAYVPFLCLIPFTRTDRTPFISGHIRIGLLLFVVEIFAVILRFLPAVWDVIIFLCVVAALAGIFHVVRGQSFSIPYLSDFFTRKS